MSDEEFPIYAKGLTPEEKKMIDKIWDQCCGDDNDE